MGFLQIPKHKGDFHVPIAISQSPSPKVASPSKNGERSSFWGSISLLEPFLNAVGLRGLEVACDLLYHRSKVENGDFVAGTSCTAHIIP